MRHLILAVLLAATPLFAATKTISDRPSTASLPQVPDKNEPAVHLTGNETREQLTTAYTTAINGLLPGLASADEQSLDTLEATVHHAGRPGAEPERLACCNAIIAALNATGTAPRVKSHLLHQLRVIGKAESVPTLIKLLADPDPHVASDAQIALDNNPACPEQNRNIFRPADACIAGDILIGMAYDELLRNDRIWDANNVFALLSKPRQVRFSSLRGSLAAARNAAVLKMLDLLAGDDVDGRTVALGFIKDLDAGGRKTLVAGSDKLPPAIKAILIESLANLDDKSALPLARASLKSSDPVLQAAGLTALARLDDAEADTAVITAMNDATGEVKCNLIRVIAQRGKHSAVPVLLAVAGSADAAVVKAAYRALGELAVGEDAPMLLDKFIAQKQPDAENAAAKALGKIVPPDRGAELLQSALSRAADKSARTALLRMFRYCSGPKALAALQAALQDKEVSVREAAARTLSDWPDPVVLDTLVAIYQKSEKPAFGVVALRGIVRLAQAANKQPSPALVVRYRQLLADARNDDDRRRVLGALGGCGDVGALELAVAQLATPNLRAEAEAAVKNIAELVRKKHPKEAKAALQQLKPQ